MAKSIRAGEPSTSRVGRPSKLNPEVQAAIVLAIRSCKLSLADCARSAGLGEGTVFEWLNRGKRAKRGKFHEFAMAVGQARAEGTQLLLSRVAKAGQEPKHWQANMALLAVTEPRYSPRVRAVVEQEFDAALDRLTAEFEAEPELLERALSAIAGEPVEGGRGAGDCTPAGDLVAPGARS